MSIENLEKIEKKLLHYTGKAISEFEMIKTGDKVMVCLSGGKDSFTMLSILRLLQQRSNNKFKLFSFTLDQAQPGWNDTKLKSWLAEHKVDHVVHKEDTYSIVTEKVPAGNTYCSLCSRMRRGIIYSYAKKHGFNKIALGHHRDDLITTLLMSILYNGKISGMPPKLLSDDKQNIVIRPLAFCQEKDIAEYARLKEFPIIPCNLCGSQENLMRKHTKKLIDELAERNPKVPSNILHALSSVHPSQLMDKDLWDFKALETKLEVSAV